MMQPFLCADASRTPKLVSRTRSRSKSAMLQNHGCRAQLPDRVGLLQNPLGRLA